MEHADKIFPVGAFSPLIGMRKEDYVNNTYYCDNNIIKLISIIN